MEWSRGEFCISTDNTRLDIDAIHQFLDLSYWAAGIPREVLVKSIQNSLAFGIFKGSTQAGFARVVTDYSTFAYIGDVFVMEEFRGLGLSKWLMQVIISHPELQGFRVWLLVTTDAHGLYRQFGFKSLERPERVMELRFKNVYGVGHSPDANTMGQT
jgi:GNAT superfamily N-acetyltransferase